MKIAAALTALLTVLTLTACSGSPELPPVGYDREGNAYDYEDFGGTTAQPSPGVPDDDVAVMAFLATVGQEIPGRSDDDLLALGGDVCASLQAVSSPTEADAYRVGLDLVEEENLTLTQAGALSGSAVAAFCPQFRYLIGGNS